MTGAEFKIRTVLILTLLTVWAGCAAVKLYQCTVRDRTELLKKSRRIAWRTADIPAQRGKITDRNGIVLAQDVFCCDLFLCQRPKSPKRTDNLFRRLKGALSDPELSPEKLKPPVVLKKNLTAQEIREFSIAFRGFPEVRLEGRFERNVYNHPAIHELIGKTAANDRKAMVGISGLEQKHDLILSGKSGRMTVMLDRNGSWIYETLRITRQPENGHDLKLEQSLQELLNTGDRNGQ